MTGSGGGGGIVPGPAASILRITTLVSMMCIVQCHGRMDNIVAMSVIIFIMHCSLHLLRLIVDVAIN